MPGRLSPLALVLPQLLLGCTPVPKEFRCASAAQCQLTSGPMGSCEPDGHCSVMDTSCPSGRHFVAAGALTNGCVGSIDAGALGDGASPYVCPSDVILCEEFESAATLADLKGWYVVTRNGTPEITTARAHRGVHSGHFPITAFTPPDYAQSQITSPRALPTTGLLSARAYFYLSTQQVPASVGLMALTQAVTPYNGPTLSVDSADHLVANGPKNMGTPSTATVPRDRWVCIEWEITLSDTGGIANVFIDDAQVLGQSLAGSQLNPPLGQLVVGAAVLGAVTQPGPVPASDVWIDSIILDTKHSGCAR